MSQLIVNEWSSEKIEQEIIENININRFKTAIMEAMSKISFVCLNFSMFRLVFYPFNLQTKQLLENFHPTFKLQIFQKCSYNISWQYIIDQTGQYFRVFVRVGSVKLQNQPWLFEKYSSVRNSLINHYNSKDSSWKLSYDESLHSLCILSANQHSILLTRNSQFVTSTWSKIKEEIISMFLINSRVYETLTEQQGEDLKLIRDRYEAYNEFKTHKSFHYEIKENLTKYKKMVTQVEEKLVICKKQPIINRSSLQSQKNTFSNREHILNSQNKFILDKVKNIKELQQNSNQLKAQSKYSIYEKALGIQKQSQSTTTQHQNMKIFQTHAICQGIKVQQLLQGLSQTAYNLSAIVIGLFRFSYHTSIHYHFQNDSCEVSMNKTSSDDSKDQDNRQNLEKENKLQVKRNDQSVVEQTSVQYLAMKVCLTGDQKHKTNRIIASQQSFLNEYRFLKFARQKVFPYISKYFLPVQVSNQSKSLSQKSKEQLILKQQIYMTYYPIDLNCLLKKDHYFLNFSVQKILDILFEIAATLRFLDRLQIIHRDIKPTNIMIDCEDNVKFIDWGSCCTRQFYEPFIETHEIEEKQTLEMGIKFSTQLESDDQRDQQNDEEDYRRKLKHIRKKVNDDPVFLESKQRLLTTQGQSQLTSQFIKSNKQLFEQLYGKISQKDNHCTAKKKFEKNYYFDVYSFGKIVEEFQSKLSAKYHWNDDFWLRPQLEYLKTKCLSINPYERLCPLEILIYLGELIKIAKSKKTIVTQIDMSWNGVATELKNN